MVDLDAIEGYPEKVNDCSAPAYVYILRLFDDHYYVGVSKQPKRRIISHVRGESVSPAWVRQYPPVAIESVLAFDDRQRATVREDEITVALARQHGPRSVRGGSWTAVDDLPPTKFGD